MSMRPILGESVPETLGYICPDRKVKAGETDPLGAALIDRNPLVTFRNDCS